MYRGFNDDKFNFKPKDEGVLIGIGLFRVQMNRPKDRVKGFLESGGDISRNLKGVSVTLTFEEIFL